jgi:hypothetical protein
MTIFTLTFFSIWEPLMDTLKYSQGKPTIQQVYLQRMLMCKDMLNVIKTIKKRSINGDKHQAVSSTMHMWCRQPGFFFNHFLPYFQDKPHNTPLLNRIKKVHMEAKANIIKSIFTNALQSLQETKSIKLKATSVAITSDKLIHFLYYCHHLHGGNINCLSSTMAKLMSAGLAIMQNYKPG